MGEAFLFLGPPGAGKGTQAARLAERRRSPHVSTGAILRDAVARGTPEGREAKAVMERGELVSDALVGKMAEARLREKDCSESFVLDGFPRNLEQARMLEGILARTGHRMGKVLYVRVGEAEVVERLGGRRVCSSCGRNYHVRFEPPKKEGACDACGGALVRRRDDEPEAVRERLAVYARQTEPLVAYFRERGLLREVDGAGTPAEVASRVRAASESEEEGAARSSVTSRVGMV